MWNWLLVAMLLFGTNEAVKVPRPPLHGGCVALVTPELAQQWHQLTDSHGVHVDVERRLYEVENIDRYYIHVRITNDNERPVSVDLRDAHLTIFPNQWELQRLPFRGPVDEWRPAHSLDLDKERELIDRHKSHKLSEIQPHEIFDFYRESPFPLDNAGGFGDGCYLIVSLAGQLQFTDGYAVWQVDTDRLSSIKANVVINPAEMVFPLPIALLPLPESARIIHSTPTL